jgi:hypothetical protein
MNLCVPLIILCVCRNIPLFDSRGALGFPYGFIPPGTDEYEQAKVQSPCVCICAYALNCLFLRVWLQAAGFYFVPHLSLGDEGSCTNWQTHTDTHTQSQPRTDTNTRTNNVSTNPNTVSNAVGSVLSSVVSVLTFPVTMWLPNTSAQTNKRAANSVKGTDTLVTNNSKSRMRTNTDDMDVDSNSEAAQTDTSSSSSTAHFTDTDAFTQQPTTQASTQSGKQTLATNTHPEYAGRYIWYSSGRVGGGQKIFKFARRVPPHPAMYVCVYVCL